MLPIEMPLENAPAPPRHAVWRRGLAWLLAPLFIGTAVSGSAQQTVDLGAYPGARRPQYLGISARSQYLKMDDGTRLAVDILLPGDLPPSARLPTIIRWTRNGRAVRNSDPTALDRFFVEHGYARILVDERGSGASFGVEKYGPQNLQDMRQVVDWILSQPWSNGKVGAAGETYDGRAAELLAASGHPAVKAVASQYSNFDDLIEQVMPGGIFAEWPMEASSRQAERRDEGPSAKPVDEDRNSALLKQAVRDHRANPDIASLSRKLTFRDDTIPELAMPAGGLSLSAQKEAIERSGVALYLQEGWLDGASAAGALRQFNELQNSQRLVIGPWNRLGTRTSNPFSSNEALPMTRLQQWSDLLTFFDRNLRDDTTPAGKQIFFYTMGEEKWKTTNQWPPAGSSRLRLHFSMDLSLASENGASGTVAYATNSETTTGPANRWHTPVIPAPVRYQNLEEGRLAFTSAPFTENSELTGTSSITLRVRSTHADAAFFAYLEVLPPFGTPRYVTEGQLRGLHRNSSEYLKKDAAPLKPGEWADVTFELLPHSVLVSKGDRIRVSLSGFDKGTFARVPSDGNPAWTVDCGASFVDLAVVRPQAPGPVVRLPEDPDPLGLKGWAGRFPQGSEYLEVLPSFDHLTVIQAGQSVLEQTARVKPADRTKVAERNRIAKEIADGLAIEDIGPLSKAVTLLLRPMTKSLLDEWRSISNRTGSVASVEVMGTVDYPEKNWATSYLFVRGPRGYAVFTIRWSGMKVSGWGQNDGFPAVRDYFPTVDGTFVSAAREGLPAARVRKVGDVVEFVK